MRKEQKRKVYKMPEKKYFDLIFVIVNIGKASRVLAEAKKIGITGGTITLGHGTVNSGLLRRMGLSEVRKEVLLMVSKRDLTLPTIAHIKKTFRLEESNRGIVFSTRVSSLVGTQGQRYDMHMDDTSLEATHELFVSIVSADEGENVVDAVREAGGAGGTIISGLGAFAETVTKVFGIEISSEKDIVLNLVGKHLADSIERHLVKKVDFSDKDSGILFSIDVENVRGIYEG